MIYKFRVLFEDYDDVYRDIEIKTIQTFEELKNTILSAVGFDHHHDYTFYVSDDFWRKGREINKKKDGTDANMAKRFICDFVDDPHQKFLFFYDANAQWSFQIELIKISQEDAKAIYPNCVKSSGTAPKQYKIVHTPSIRLDDEDNPVKERRGRKPGVKKEAVVDEDIDTEDLIEEEETEQEEERNFVDEEDMEEGYHDEKGDDEDDFSNNDDEDFDPNYGDGDEDSYSRASDDY